MSWLWHEWPQHICLSIWKCAAVLYLEKIRAHQCPMLAGVGAGPAGDAPITRSYLPIPNNPQLTPLPQLLVIEDRLQTLLPEPVVEEGNVLRISSLTQHSPPPTDIFLLDSGGLACI